MRMAVAARRTVASPKTRAIVSLTETEALSVEAKEYDS